MRRWDCRSRSRWMWGWGVTGAPLIRRRMLKQAAGRVLSRTPPGDVREAVRLSRRAPCGLAGSPFEHPDMLRTVHSA
ncbi:MAG: hypothetical protein LZF60_270285 [Nitrospira sp.]|nr:MAG: hypothetical protein LZF60_270285 [Nitrospira sp.]